MLDRKTFFIREHVGMLKLSDTYDILNPETQEQIGIAKEKPGGFIIFLRFFINKRLLPTKVHIYEGGDSDDESKLLLTIDRGFTLFRSKIKIIDKSNNLIGWFKSKLFSFGGAFRVLNPDESEVALVKGDWKGWNFKFLDKSETEIGTITKKWAGLGKELFTSADNYMISLNEKASSAHALILLAAGIAVDTVYKEK